MTGSGPDGTWDDDDRAIARALGADARDSGVDADALAEYEAVLSHLPFAEIPPAAELEDRVIAAALATRPAAARSIESARSARETRRSAAPRWIAAGAALAAAAAIVVVLAVGQSGNGPRAPGARIEPAAASGSLTHVLGERGTREGTLRTGTGATPGRVALSPDGQGYLYDLAPVRSANARWLWLDTSSGPVRVGRLAGSADLHFVVRGAVDAVKGAFVTNEPNAGTPTTPGAVTSRAAFAVS